MQIFLKFLYLIVLDDELKLVCEENNEYDKFAVVVYSINNNKIGYIPKYYSESVFQAIKRGYKVTCNVIDFYKSGNCNECLKAKLAICIKV